MEIITNKARWHFIIYDNIPMEACALCNTNIDTIKPTSAVDVLYTGSEVNLSTKTFYQIQTNRLGQTQPIPRKRNKTERQTFVPASCQY